MTRDELIIHWRELLAVPDDAGDALTRWWCRTAAATFLLEVAVPWAAQLATPRPTAEELRELEDVERGLAEAVLTVARLEAEGFDPAAAPQTAMGRDASAQLDATERQFAELQADERSGKLLRKAAVVAALDRGLSGALEIVRRETQAASPHLQSGAWTDAEINAWWARVTDTAMQRISGELTLVGLPAGEAPAS